MSDSSVDSSKYLNMQRIVQVARCGRVDTDNDVASAGNASVGKGSGGFNARKPAISPRTHF